jgi:hypothetical protein
MHGPPPFDGDAAGSPARAEQRSGDRGHGTAPEFAIIGGLCGLIYLYAYLAYASARTVFGPWGISGRGLAGRYAYRWEQIDNVAVRAYTSRGWKAPAAGLAATSGVVLAAELLTVPSYLRRRRRLRAGLAQLGAADASSAP